MSEGHLDDASIIIDVHEALTNALDDEVNLEIENDLMNELFEKPESVMDKVMTSTAHMMGQKSVSTDTLSKI